MNFSGNQPGRSVWFWQNEHERVRSAPSPSDALKMNKIQRSHERFPLNLSCSLTRLTVSSACTRHTRQQLNIYRARSLLPQFDHFHPQKDKLSKLVEFNAPIGLWCCSLWGHHLLINTRTTTCVHSMITLRRFMELRVSPTSPCFNHTSPKNSPHESNQWTIKPRVMLHLNYTRWNHYYHYPASTAEAVNYTRHHGDKWGEKPSLATC